MTRSSTSRRAGMGFVVAGLIVVSLAALAPSGATEANPSPYYGDIECSDLGLSGFTITTQPEATVYTTSDSEVEVTGDVPADLQIAITDLVVNGNTITFNWWATVDDGPDADLDRDTFHIDVVLIAFGGGGLRWDYEQPGETNDTAWATAYLIDHVSFCFDAEDGETTSTTYGPSTTTTVGSTTTTTEGSTTSTTEGTTTTTAPTTTTILGTTTSTTEGTTTTTEGGTGGTTTTTEAPTTTTTEGTTTTTEGGSTTTTEAPTTTTTEGTTTTTEGGTTTTTDGTTTTTAGGGGTTTTTIGGGGTTTTNGGGPSVLDTGATSGGQDVLGAAQGNSGALPATGTDPTLLILAGAVLTAVGIALVARSRTS